MPFYSVRETNSPAIKNAPIEGLAEGNGSFNNIHLAALVLVVPWFVKRLLPLANKGGFKTYIFLVLLLGVPVTMAYWTIMSMYGKRKNEKIQLPDRNLEEYMTIHDPELKTKYYGKQKIPMQVFHDAFFEGKIDFNGEHYHPTRRTPSNLRAAATGDVLDVLEQRHDWAKMVFTLELFKYVFFNLIPDVIRHTEAQDEEQVRDHYDRMHLPALLPCPLAHKSVQEATISTSGSWDLVWSIHPELFGISALKRHSNSCKTTSLRSFVRRYFCCLLRVLYTDRAL